MGSLVADFHRNLLKGGIYIYPKTTAAPLGRLRLLYECAPLAWIAEEAGGKATDGTQRILDIVPTDLHQRTPYFIGSTTNGRKGRKLYERIGETTPTHRIIQRTCCLTIIAAGSNR